MHMRRKTLGIIVMAAVAVAAISAQSALAGPAQSVAACLKMVPGSPSGPPSTRGGTTTRAGSISRSRARCPGRTVSSSTR